MANHENNRNRNQRSSSRYDDYGADRGDQSFNERWNDQSERRRYEGGDQYRSGNNDYSQGRDHRNFNSGYSDNSYLNERWRGDNDNSESRGRYGNSTGVNRGSSSGRDQGNWSSSGRGNRSGSGQEYGYDRNRFENDRDNDRGWFERTADEVSSWFGDDDAARRRKMDEVRGQHRGKGPKSYTRSDERIKDDVNDRLSDDDQVDASDIEVSVSSGEVTLTGTVSSRWEKRRAEDVAEGVSGVKDVENRIKVNAQNNTGGGSRGSADTGSNPGSYGVPYGSSGAAPVGAFDIGKS